LYKLKKGAAKRSYGLNVARLAEVPTDVLVEASRKSRELENMMKRKQSQRDALIRLKDLLARLESRPAEREKTWAELAELQKTVTEQHLVA
jgi:DNA mismatch repair ATPase MutS